jgi:hypothetical protein
MATRKPLALLAFLLCWPASAQTSEPTRQPGSAPSSQPGTQPLSLPATEPASEPAPPASAPAPRLPKRLKPKLSGYLQVHYRYAFDTGEPKGTVDFSDFRVQRLRLKVEGEVFPWLSYDVEVDPRTPELDGLLRDAFVTVRLPQHQRLRLGQQKTQFGYENRESSTRLFAVNRTEVSDNLSRGVNLRDIGLGLIGYIPLRDDLRIEDAITLVNGAGLNVQADETATKNVWGRVGLRYKSGGSKLWLGVSGGRGDFTELADPLVPGEVDTLVKFRRLGVDLELDHPRAFLSAEWVYGIDEIGSGIEDTQGYYINLVGKTPWQVGPIARFDALDDEFQRFTLGAYYGLPGEALRVMVNYELRLVKDDVRGDDKLFTWVQVVF